MRTLERRHNTLETEVDGEGTWAISYGDMITLLLSFFVLFFTVDPKAEKASELQRSLVVALTENLEESQKPRTPQNAKLNIGEEDAENIDPKILKKLGAEVHQVGDQIFIDFPDVSFFDSAETRVTDLGQKALNKFAETFVPFAGQYVVGIRAFTDYRKVIQYKNRPFKDNLELSALRSVSALRVLQSAGLPLDRIRLGGYGEIKTAQAIVTQNKSLDELSKTELLALSRKVVLVVEAASQIEEEDRI